MSQQSKSPFKKLSDVAAEVTRLIFPVKLGEPPTPKMSSEETLAPPALFPRSWSLPTSRTAEHRGCIVCAGRPLLWCPEGTIENSPAFQRWVGRRKVASPEGTAEVRSLTPSFSRPFGTFLPCGIFPGVKTPGYSQDVPPGQRNLVAAFSGKEATRFTSDALRASVSSNLIFGVVVLNHLLIPVILSRLYVVCYVT